MELLNEVQQFGTHAGSHKRTAVLASRFCQSGILAIEAPSKYPIIAGRFGSTGSFHGIPPKFGGMMTQNDTEGQDLNESLFTSGRTSGSRLFKGRQGKWWKERGQKSIRRDAGGRGWGASALDY